MEYAVSGQDTPNINLNIDSEAQREIRIAIKEGKKIELVALYKKVHRENG